MSDAATSADHGLLSVLVGFGQALRDEGLAVGTGDVLTFCQAMAPLDPTDLADLYWAGRTCMVTRREDIETYDEVFRAYFLDAHTPVQELLKLQTHAAGETSAAVDIPLTDPKGEESDDEEAHLGLMASNIEILKSKSFGECSPEELQALRRLMAQFRLRPPRRRTRRTKCADKGVRPDLRRTIRASLRTHGEMLELFYRQRRVRHRKLVLVLDVSGSMADYSRALLQFAYCATRASDKVEVFAFGTRLSRLTDSLERRNPDEALQLAAEEVVDWEGGTRIGDSLQTFLQHWGRKGLARGSVVVICSDGLDRGDPETLASAMERLRRLCHRIVWMNPHKGDDESFAPQTVGMLAAWPYIDVVESGHDLRSLEELADLLPELA